MTLILCYCCSFGYLVAFIWVVCRLIFYDLISFDLLLFQIAHLLNEAQQFILQNFAYNIISKLNKNLLGYKSVRMLGWMYENILMLKSHTTEHVTEKLHFTSWQGDCQVYKNIAYIYIWFLIPKALFARFEMNLSTQHFTKLINNHHRTSEKT